MNYYLKPDILEKLSMGDFETLRNILLSHGYSKIIASEVKVFQLAQFVPTLVKALQNTQVHTLDLSYNNITQYAPTLVQALQNTQVHTLDLSCNHIAQYAPAVAQALQNTQVHTLDLSCNHIAQHAPEFTQALQNTQVHTLKLAGNNIAQYAPAVAQALQNTSVHTLHLSYNYIAEHALEFAQALQNTQVHTLNLSKNQIAQHASVVAQVLQHTSVHTLDLSYNNIVQHAPAVAQALQHTQVHTLDLTYNHIAQYAPAFTQALRETNITTLHLSYNFINTETTLPFFQALQGTKIRKLAFSNDVNPDSKLFEPIIKALANTSICAIKGIDSQEIQNAVLENCQRIYIERLTIAEYQGTILKTLYQQTFPWNEVAFPTAIARRIMKFLGYHDDQNLQKRFLNQLKLHAISRPISLVEDRSPVIKRQKIN